MIVINDAPASQNDGLTPSSLFLNGADNFCESIWSSDWAACIPSRRSGRRTGPDELEMSSRLGLNEIFSGRIFSTVFESRSGEKQPFAQPPRKPCKFGDTNIAPPLLRRDQ